MEKLGINLIQILAQLLNVGILLVVLKKFLYRPILKLLEDRKRTIDEGLKLQMEMSEKSLKLEDKGKKLERKLRVEAEKQSKKTRDEAKKAAEEIIEKARKRAAEIRSQARDESKIELENKLKKLDERVFQEARHLANQALMKVLDKSTRIKITEAQIKSVAKIK